MARSVTRPASIIQGLARRYSPREILSFIAWLDTAAAFGIKRVVHRDGRATRVRVGDNQLRRTNRTKPTIGVLIIAQDEAELIERALTSVGTIADDIVLVDGGSADATADKAAGVGARVLRRAFDNDYAAQRNFGLAHLNTSWVFVIDADEVLSEELGAMLVDLAAQSAADSVFVPRLTTLSDDPGRPAFWPDAQLRMFRRGVRYEGRLHEQPVGWRRPLCTPISGPYLLHRISRLRLYRRASHYAALDPTPYSDEWLTWARSEIERLETAEADDDSRG